MRYDERVIFSFSYEGLIDGELLRWFRFLHFCKWLLRHGYCYHWVLLHLPVPLDSRRSWWFYTLCPDLCLTSFLYRVSTGLQAIVLHGVVCVLISIVGPYCSEVTEVTEKKVSWEKLFAAGRCLKCHVQSKQPLICPKVSVGPRCRRWLWTVVLGQRARGY